MALGMHQHMRISGQMCSAGPARPTLACCSHRPAPMPSHATAGGMCAPATSKLLAAQLTCSSRIRVCQHIAGPSRRMSTCSLAARDEAVADQAAAPAPAAASAAAPPPEYEAPEYEAASQMLDKFIAALQQPAQPQQQGEQQRPQPASSAGQEPGSAPSAPATADDAASRPPSLQQQGLSDEQLAALLAHVPSIAEEDPTRVRAWLDAVCTGTGLMLGQAAELITVLPGAWGRPAEGLVSRLNGLAKDLGVSAEEAAALLAAVPPLFSINNSTIIKDKFDSLALRLGVPTPTLVNLVSRQPVIWSISPRHVKAGVPRLCERLGLTTEQAVELVARVPVVLALESGLLNMQVGALSSTLGVPVEWLLELLGRCLSLVAVPAEVLGANLTNLAAALDVRVEAVLLLVAEQPTLLAAQLPSLVAALDAVQTGLQMNSRAEALQVLAAQPALLYDNTATTINDKLDSLATVFGVPVQEMRALAQQQPVLLAVAPYTLRSALNAASEASDGLAEPRQCLEVLMQDPGAFMSLAFSEDQLVSWVGRLGLEDEEGVDQLLAANPALLDMPANTVKARLESLAALFDIPLNITAQLVARNMPLAAIPPNVVITRVKGLSLALGVSMQTMAVLVAKAPALLACAVTGPGEVNRDLKPYVDLVAEVVAAYEFYTMEWLERSIKEVAPARVRSFSSLDRR